MIQIRRSFRRVARERELTKSLLVFPKLGVIKKLVHQTKPASNISSTDGCWKVLYETVELLKKVDPLIGDAKPSKGYFSDCKLELVGAQQYVSPTNNGKKIYDSPSMLLQVIAVEDSVIYYVLFLVKVSNVGIKSPIITVSRDQEVLRSSFIVPASKGSNKHCQMTIRFSQQHAVIPIPSISHCLPGVVCDRSCKVKWGFSIVDLPLAMLIQQQQADGSSW